MSGTIEAFQNAFVIGVGATAIMDAWAVLLRLGFGIPSLNYAFVGRWLGHLVYGTFTHSNIAHALPIRGETVIGWTAHYVVGVVFAAGLLAVVGSDWPKQPTMLPALIVGWITMGAPFFVMQPGMGLGVAASNTPKPGQSRLRTLTTHTVFGLGLFAAAWLVR